uniref:peptidylprolyl isomerase n=1 Tax=Sarcophilus harrisii TaxID=9305 RepID=G3VVI0_SARHA
MVGLGEGAGGERRGGRGGRTRRRKKASSLPPPGRPRPAPPRPAGPAPPRPPRAAPGPSRPETGDAPGVAPGAGRGLGYDRGSTFNVLVGKGQLIAGMDKALVGMCVNERRFVKIPPQLAYGSEGVPDVIPPDSVLHFDVLLMDLWNSEDQVQVHTYFKPANCSRTIQVSDFVRYHYNGTFLDGTLFDSSHNRMKTYDTYVGIGWLIPGMDRGLLGMCVGEKRIITIPPFLAYGEEGDGKDIPGQASLVFDVALLDLHNPKDGVAVESTFLPRDCERRSRAGDFLRYHYNASLLDGTLFDSSYARNRTFDTYIGQGYVIAGMDEGLLGVCIGERRRIVIPPHLAYGEEGRGNIPGSAVLVFDIHVVDFHNPSDSVQVTSRYKPDNCSVLSKKGDYLKYHYNASLMDGTRLDSTLSLGKTYNIVLGSGQVVLGMDMGLRDMCVGEKRTVVIPPHLGYGEAGVAGEVPGSAVLVFDIELLDLVSGLPEGYMFIWNDEVSPNLFEEIDKDGNGEVLLEEFSEYIHAQVAAGKGRLAPGFEAAVIVQSMFTNQDRDGDGRVTAEEFKLKDQEARHDEL